MMILGALLFAFSGVVLLLGGRSIMINANDALIGGIGALFGFAGLACLLAAPLMLLP